MVMRLKLFVCLLSFFSVNKMVFSADILWDAAHTYTIPDDGNTWYLDQSLSLTSTLYVEGVFEIRSGGALTIDEAVVNGGDASGVTDGISGNKIGMEVYGTVVINGNGEINFKGGGGGQGSDVSSGTGGSGGDGGQIELFVFENGVIVIEADGTMTLTGGSGGAGGGATVGGIGGDGGNGGRILLQDEGMISVRREGQFFLFGGFGGKGGSASGGTSEGGDGGLGGSCIVFGKGSIREEEGGFFEIILGDGNNGGDGASGGTGGDSGSGGIFSIGGKEIGDFVTFEIIKSSCKIICGNGGNGGDDVDSSSDGGDGGGLFLQSQFVATMVGESSFETIRGNNGIDGNGLNEGNGGSGGVLYVLSEKMRFVCKLKEFFYCDPLITLSQTLDIDFTWTITSDKSIFGNGNKIVLGPNGEIVLDGTVKGGGVTVQFDNLSIDGIHDYNVRCIDDDSTISLDDVMISMDADYTFTKGAITVAGNCIVDGGWTKFLYQSTQPLTIGLNAELKFVPHAIFEYDTSPNTLLQMTSGTSVLYLNNATLLATQPLAFSTGVLSTEGLAIVQGDAQLSLAGLSDIIVRGALARVGDVVI